MALCRGPRRETLDAFGRLDFAVNNAGTEGPIAGLTDMPAEEWQSVLDVNLKGAFLCMKYEARAMLDGGQGAAIAFLCSEEASYITGTPLTVDGGYLMTM